VQIDRRAILQKIVNDHSSTEVERTEAQHELAEMEARCPQDQVIERYLDAGITRDEWELVDLETKTFCLGLARTGEDYYVDHREENLDRLLRLYARTASARVRDAVVATVRLIHRHHRELLLPDNRARHDAYIDEPGYDQQLIRRFFLRGDGWAGIKRIEQKAADFLESVSA
jgi:hypothetical protein